MAIGGFARDGSTGAIVGRRAAEQKWLPTARGILTEVARTPWATITAADLADQVQAETLVRPFGHLKSWFPAFLVSLGQACFDADEPSLTALVLSDGKVGEGYDAVRALRGASLPDDAHERELLAAADRIECYRWAGAPEPAGGWHPRHLRAATSATPSRRPERAPRAPVAPKPIKPADAPRALCPRCFMQLPATGRCDTCD